MVFGACSVTVIFLFADEWNECHEHMCAEDQFDCKCRRDVHTGEKECIDIAWLCDGIPDCRDEEDETDCICSKDEYQCNNCIRGEECDDEIPYHQCINMSKVKDGKQDCFNGNDEPQRYLKLIILTLNIKTI